MDREQFNISITPYHEKILEIPLYKDTYLLLELSISVFQQSPRLILDTLCNKAIDLEINIISLIIEAYKIENKEAYLKKILSAHLKLYTLVKLIIDNSKVCQENASRFVTLLELIGKQSNAWLKSRGLEQV